MTKLEELKANLDAANAAVDDAVDAYVAAAWADAAYDVARAAARAAAAAREAYKAELEKQKENEELKAVPDATVCTAVYKTAKELCDAGAELVDHKCEPTWNDAGHWNTWIYKLPEGTFWKVHQPSDYLSSVEVSQVERVVTEVVEFKENCDD